MGIASRILKNAGMRDEAKKMCGRIIDSSSYYEALNIIVECANITDSEQNHDMDKGPQMNM